MSFTDKINGLLEATIKASLVEGLKHDRYVRSHKQKPKNIEATWAFTTKKDGWPEENEMVMISGKKLNDAAKEAMKQLKAKDIYVMESSEELEEKINKFLEGQSEFAYAAARAKEAGKKEFKFAGKTWPVTIKTDIPESIDTSAALDEVKKSDPPFDVSKGDYTGAAKELSQYAKTKGGIDKEDFLAFANRMASLSKNKSPSVLSKFARDLESLDTSPREKIVTVMRDHGFKVTASKRGLTIEDAKTLTANRPHRQGKVQYKQDNETNQRQAVKDREDKLFAEGQKLFMFKTKAEADKKAKEIKGKVVELSPKHFAVMTKDLTVVDEAAKAAVNWKKGADAVKKVSRLQISKDMVATFNDMIVNMEKLARSPNILQSSGFIASINKDYGLLAKNKDIKDELDKALKSAGLMESLLAEKYTYDVFDFMADLDPPEEKKMKQDMKKAGIKMVKPKDQSNALFGGDHVQFIGRNEKSVKAFIDTWVGLDDLLMHKEASFETPSNEKKLAEIGRKMMDMAQKEKNDTLSNAMSRLGDLLTKYGTTYGPKDMKDLEKKSGMKLAIIIDLMKRVNKK